MNSKFDQYTKFDLSRVERERNRSMASIGKKACVVGGSGFVACQLIKILLEKGYAVNTTVRDPGLPLCLSLLNDAAESLSRGSHVHAHIFSYQVRGSACYNIYIILFIICI